MYATHGDLNLELRVVGNEKYTWRFTTDNGDGMIISFKGGLSKPDDICYEQWIEQLETIIGFIKTKKEKLMEIEQNAITWDYGNIGMQYDGDIKDLHKEKMRTLITLLTMIWNRQGRGEIQITAGKLAEEVILEAVAATGGDLSLTDNIIVDETLPDNAAMVGKQALYINSDCTIPFMFHTPFSSSS